MPTTIMLALAIVLVGLSTFCPPTWTTIVRVVGIVLAAVVLVLALFAG